MSTASLAHPASLAASALSRERRVLLSCLKTPLRAGEALLLREELEGELDWDDLLALAARHRVMPLLFWSLQSVGWPSVPPDVRAFLSHEFQLNAARTFGLSRELLLVSQRLREHGIPMVSFKGPTLAQAAYGSVGLRQFGDLDVLVPRREVLRARQVLLESGYRSRIELAPSQEAAHLRDDSVFDLLRDAASEGGQGGQLLFLELHWAVTSRCFARPITFEHVQSRLHQGALAGAEAERLEAADLLVILCVHGTKHVWERLQWIADVSQLLRQAEPCAEPGAKASAVGDLDWDRVRGLAARFNVERMVALGLVMASDVLQAPVPPQVLSWARALSGVEALSAQAQHELFAPRPEPGEAASLSGTWFLMRAMDSWRDRARFALHVATTPPAEERAAVVLPGALERLRPIVRPVLLLSSHLSHARQARRARGAGS